jgi:glutamyl-tRNA synthetase
MERAEVRVRFSPAPTGELHVGSARTALFNWFYARHTGGSFLLRVEDTDVSRTREEWVAGIEDTLTWLGLDWDGEPVRQSTRFADYLAAADRLVAEGRAYECFETPEELDAMNAQRKAEGLPPGYDGRGRDLTAAERAALAAEGRPRTVRFRTPDTGTSTFRDAIRGDVSVEWSTISDFVIVRSDGNPLFFLANAVDDLAMGITHVIRGEDLIDSTHRVLALRAALGGAEPPVYAHLPLILRADRAKLSKRHGAVAVEDFRARGVLPEALLNYLALLGWAPDDGQEVLTRDEIAQLFTLERVTHSAAVFDEKKLEWLNGEWIRRLPLDDLVDRVRPYAVAAYGDDIDAAALRDGVRIAQERATSLVAVVEQMDFLLTPADAFALGDDAWERVASVAGAGEALDAAIAHVRECEWTEAALDLRPPLEAVGLKMGKVAKVLYTAIEGRPNGLPLFPSMLMLGREESVRRLEAARARLGSG